MHLPVEKLLLISFENLFTMKIRYHPTKVHLLQSMSFLMDKLPDHMITIEDVLKESCVSRGSLYHHFDDFQHLVESCRVYRYGLWIDATIDYLNSRIEASTSKDNMILIFREITKAVHSDRRKNARADRAATLALASQNERMKRMLTIEVDRLTLSITSIVQELISKEYLHHDTNPKTFATFIQALALGKIVNDYNIDGVTEDEWNEMIMKIYLDSFFKK